MTTSHNSHPESTHQFRAAESGRLRLLSGRWLVLPAVALLILAVGGAQYGPKMSYQEFRETKRKISLLPQEDRERLDRNLKFYEQLTEQQKQEYWELHKYIGEHKLSPLVDQYLAWLDTLSPFERNQLRTSPEAAVQIATVEKILKENQHNSDHLLPELLGRIIAKEDHRMSMFQIVLDPGRSVNKTTPFLLHQEQLDKIIDGIIYTQLPVAQRDEIDSLKKNGFERKYRTLSASVAIAKNLGIEWPGQQILTLLEAEGVTLRSDEQGNTGAFVRFRLNNNWEMFDRIAFRSLLIRSLIVAEMRSFEQKNNYSNTDLQAFFAELDTPQQAAILNSPADYQAEALKWLYLWETNQRSILFTRPEIMMPIFSDIGQRGFFDRRPGGGPGGGRPGGGPGGDRDRE
ncbi:MAG: hypothetical protein KDA78_17715, partial [Planctomycetaceae bacterium]|nr:hypothetical protein [Planctomycetaceae bacterium]